MHDVYILVAWRTKEVDEQIYQNANSMEQYVNTVTVVYTFENAMHEWKQVNSSFSSTTHCRSLVSTLVGKPEKFKSSICTLFNHTKGPQFTIELGRVCVTCLVVARFRLKKTLDSQFVMPWFCCKLYHGIALAFEAVSKPAQKTTDWIELADGIM